jgi:hypothetical protein
VAAVVVVAEVAEVAEAVQSSGKRPSDTIVMSRA